MSKSFLSIGKPKLEFSNVDPVQDVKTSMDFGYLYPVCVRECLPGDKIRYGVESVVRLNPTIAPVMHKMDIRFEAFFVPNRLVWDKWEEFITGGEQGNAVPDMPLHDSVYMQDAPCGGTGAMGRASLWNAFGLPSYEHPSLITGLDFFPNAFVSWYNNLDMDEQAAITPIDLPFRAYLKIWNDFYRDENVQEEQDITDQNNTMFLKSRCWSKNDYFTSALPFVLRGFAPSLSFGISGLTASTVVDNDFLRFVSYPEKGSYQGVNYPINNVDSIDNSSMLPSNASRALVFNVAPLGDSAEGKDLLAYKSRTDALDQDGTRDYSYYGFKSPSVAETSIDSSNVQSTIQASDIRWIMQVQKFLERNARGGSRYVEQVLSHFGVYTGDYRLQRPEFLGSTKSPIIVSEIPQTSATDGSKVQGNLAGRGLGAVSSQFVKYRVKEHGYFIVLASITPRLSYCSQGVNKSWIKKSRYSYYFPEFSHLTEQPIKKSEIYLKTSVIPTESSSDFNKNFLDFGFSGIYNEYRTFPDQVNGLLRKDMMYWHLARNFENIPSLNEDFLSIAKNFTADDLTNADDFVTYANPLNRIFAVPSTAGFIVDICNICHMHRPIPALAEPGLVDHF